MGRPNVTCFIDFFGNAAGNFAHYYLQLSSTLNLIVSLRYPLFVVVGGRGKAEGAWQGETFTCNLPCKKLSEARGGRTLPRPRPATGEFGRRQQTQRDVPLEKHAAGFAHGQILGMGEKKNRQLHAKSPAGESNVDCGPDGGRYRLRPGGPGIAVGGETNVPDDVLDVLQLPVGGMAIGKTHGDGAGDGLVLIRSAGFQRMPGNAHAVQ